MAAVSDGVVAAWAWSPYVEIVAAGVTPDPCWLAGIHFHTNAVETFYGDLAIASGGVGAEVDLAIIPVRSIVVGVTAMLIATVTDLPILLAKAIRITGSPRLAVRLRKSTAASAAGGTLKVICLGGLGT
ncbi:MAG: hypothetical protein Q7J06_06565 [Bacteroidales bacterium]|nr:hypothetical protein [Bacteroidales bacterium]